VSDRVAILERALRWYADPRNWREDDWNVRGVIASPDYGDPGKKARNALRRAARAAATTSTTEE
jgi:hypothetical protein